MDDLRRMVVFFHVVEAQSFSSTARQLGIARSAVSRHITLLEKSIGVRLLNCTTRRLSLTEAGETYFQSCARIVAEVETATHRNTPYQPVTGRTPRNTEDCRPDQPRKPVYRSAGKGIHATILSAEYRAVTR